MCFNFVSFGEFVPKCGFNHFDLTSFLRAQTQFVPGEQKTPTQLQNFAKNASASCAWQTENLTIFKKTLLLLELLIVGWNIHLSHVKLFIFHLGLESIWKIKLDIGAIWVEKEGLSCTLGSALLVCKTFSSLGPKTPYILMDIGTLWTPSTLVCVASLGWKIAFFLGA